MRKLCILLLLTVCFHSSFGQKTKQDVLKLWKNMDSAKVEIQKHLPEMGFGSVLIYDGKVIKKVFNGYANRKTKRKYSAKTIHLWGSVSKLFTAVAIMQLVEQKKLNLNDSITKYIPELRGLPKASKYGLFSQITIQNLLNHNSGLGFVTVYKKMWEAIPAIKKRCPLKKEIIPFFKYATLNNKPGKKYQYSNSGFSLLGLVIKKITGLEYTDYVTQKIFKPLGMHTAHFGKTPKKRRKHIPTSYYTNKEGKVQDTYFNDIQGFQESNGGVKATIGDMVKFLNFIKFYDSSRKHQKVLKPKTIENYFLNFVEKNPNNHSIQMKYKSFLMAYLSGFDYYQSLRKPTTYIGHSGSIEGFISYFNFRKDQPYGVITMLNTTSVEGQKEAIAEFMVKVGHQITISTYKNKRLKMNWKDVKKFLTE